MEKRIRERIVTVLETLYKENMLNFVLGSLISADNIGEEKLKATQMAEDMLDCIDETKIPSEEKERVKRHLKTAIEINKREMEASESE